MLKISTVSVVKPNCIRLLLTDNQLINVDFSNRLETVRFGHLKDSEFFNTVRTDGEMIRWGNEIEISLSEAKTLQDRE